MGTQETGMHPIVDWSLLELHLLGEASREGETLNNTEHRLVFPPHSALL